MPKLDLFIPFTKSQEQPDGSVMVYGVLAAEAPDRSKEIMDYERSKPYFKAWSESVRKDSFGKSFGNCRYMHQLEIAGHGTQIEFNDASKTISIATKVSNPKAVQQVRDGELTGYSIGGAYVDVKKIGGLTRYIADPNEYSVVDRPCLPGATFQYVKADGTSELRKFAKYEAEPMTPEQVAKAVEAIMKSDKMASIIQEGITGSTNPSQASYGTPVEQPAFNTLETESKHINDTGVVQTGVQDDPAIPTSAGTEKCAACGCGVDKCKCVTKTYDDGFAKREFSDAKRKELADSGKALPDGSYPIVNEEDLHNAIRAIGRAKDPAKAKAHIKARAKEMGHSDALPEAWKTAGVVDDLRKLTSDPVFSGIAEALQKTISALETFGASTENTQMALTKAAQQHLQNCKAAMASACEHLDKAIAGADSAETEGGAMQSKSGEQNSTSLPTAAAGSTNGISTDIGKTVSAEQIGSIVEGKLVSMLEKIFGTTAVTAPTGARNGNVAGTQVTKAADVVVSGTASVEDDLPPVPGSENASVSPKIYKAAQNIKAQHEIPDDVQAALAGIGR